LCFLKVAYRAAKVVEICAPAIQYSMLVMSETAAVAGVRVVAAVKKSI
jgi:hypothetical protein